MPSLPSDLRTPLILIGGAVAGLLVGSAALAFYRLSSESENASIRAADAILALRDAEGNFARSQIAAQLAKETAEREEEWAIRGAFAEDYFTHADSVYESYVAQARESNRRSTNNLRSMLHDAAQGYGEMAKEIQEDMDSMKRTGRITRNDEHRSRLQKRIDELNRLQNASKP